MADKILQLIDIEKHFDGEEVLKKVNLTVYEGEFISFLGPSGSGKTTILKTIAGLITPDSGQVLIQGQDVTTLPAEKRNVNTVFQSYALFPHMNVAENVGYGLKIRKISKSVIKDKVADMLNRVGLSNFENRQVQSLSGGEKQRVALARALILNPKIILLDEPLSALDVQLRRKMQIELKTLQKKLGITFIYITHDQEEAINMSDRIIVMNKGEFHQIGTPEEIYNTPKTTFVAKFVNNANVLPCTIYKNDTIEDTPVTQVQIGTEFINIAPSNRTIGNNVCVTCLKENIRIGDENQDGNYIYGKTIDKSFVNGLIKIDFQLENGEIIIARRYGIDFNVNIGEVTKIGWYYNHAMIVGDYKNCGKHREA